jgi:hypothetical protein
MLGKIQIFLSSLSLNLVSVCKSYLATW